MSVSEFELAEVVVGKKNKPHMLSGKSWIRTSTAGFKGSYARHKVKGKMKKIPGCPMIIVKGHEVEL